MSDPGVVPDDERRDPAVLHRIGAVAKGANVSTRTLRYYEEVGLLEPSGRTPGGDRRYSDDDIGRLERILELRDVMGFDLDSIRDVLTADDRILQLRSEAQAGVSVARRREILQEAIELNRRQRELVAEKLQLLRAFADDLEMTAERYAKVAEELDLELP